MRRTELIANLALLAAPMAMAMLFMGLLIWPQGILGLASLCFVIGIGLLMRYGKLFRRSMSVRAELKQALTHTSPQMRCLGWAFIIASLLLNILILLMCLRRHGLL